MDNLKVYNLMDNINLYVIKDTKYKTLYTSVHLYRNLNREEATFNSLLTKVLKSATSKFNSYRDLSKYSENLYGLSFDVSVSKLANLSVIYSSSKVVADKYTNDKCEDEAIKLTLDLLFSPYVKDGAFYAPYVSNQKTILKDDIESVINDKRSYANYRCIEEMCKGEPNSIMTVGYIEDLDSINEKNLYDHYKKIILSSPIDIFVVGDSDEDRLVNLLKDYLSKLEFNIKNVEFKLYQNDKANEKYIEDNLNVNQGKLVMGLRTSININNPMYYALLTANSILGSGAHSKLFNNVREKMSLCYYAYSRLDKFNSLMLIGSGIEFENYEKTKNAILAEIENVKNLNFTDEELEISKEYIISSYNSYKDNPSLLIDYYMSKSFLPSFDSLDTACEKVSEVTKDDIKKAFENLKLDTIYFLNSKEGK